MKYTNKKIIYKKFWKSVINSITKSYILNIQIRPLMTENALRIKLVDPPTRLILMRTSVTHGLILIFKIYD